jgi:hypothetical protein
MQERKGIILVFIIGILAVTATIALVFLQFTNLTAKQTREFTTLTRVRFNLVTATNETLILLRKREDFGKKEYVKVLFLEGYVGNISLPQFANFEEFKEWSKGIKAIIYGYRLSLSDTATRININKPSNPDFSLKSSAIVILNNLARALQEYGFDVLDLGDKISLYKKTVGRDIINLEELLYEQTVNVLGESKSAKEKNFNILKNYVTTQNVELLVPSPENLDPKSYCDIKVENFSEAIEYRPVINLNYASPEIIYAILSGLSGYVWESGKSKLITLNDEKIHKLLKVWKEENPHFSDFINFKEFLQKQNIFTKEEIGLIIANLNPYSVYNCMNPDTSVYVDGFGAPHKYSLKTYTTEGIFHYSGIYQFEIESFAYYRGKMIAREAISSVVKLHENFNLALAKDFYSAIDRKRSKNVEVYPSYSTFDFLSGIIKLIPEPQDAKNIDLETAARNYFKVTPKSNLLKNIAILPAPFELFIHQNLVKPGHIEMNFDMKTLDALGFSFWIKPSWNPEEISGKKLVIGRIFDYDVYYFFDKNFVVDFAFVKAQKDISKWRNGTWHYVCGWMGIAKEKYGEKRPGLAYSMYLDGEPFEIVKEPDSLEEILSGIAKVFKITAKDVLAILDKIWERFEGPPAVEGVEDFLFKGFELITKTNKAMKFTVGSSYSEHYFDSSISNLRIGNITKVPMLSFYPNEGSVYLEVKNDKNDCILDLDGVNIVDYLPSGWSKKVTFYLNDKVLTEKSVIFRVQDKLGINIEFESKEEIRLESPAIFEVTMKCFLRFPSFTTVH